tara:strand:- start:3129 stop:3404 length:276 start_codon:yes stop_codon:yes gene_type:complete
MGWSDDARATIARVHATLPEDISFTARKKAIGAAYPFGEKAYWPYKAWCKAKRAYLKKYDPKQPAPPLVREMIRQRGGDDIVFPFAESSDG